MKKIMFSIVTAFACTMGASAADTQYKVYDLTMTAKTTAAKGVTTTNCGDEYVYRDRATRKIRGVIAGCGCTAAFGDPTCTNFRAIFWDETTKTALTNVTFETVLLQRVGKKGNVVEHYVTVTSEQEGENFSFTLAGFGTYKSSAKGGHFDTLTVSGSLVGLMEAPYYTVRGSCSACSYVPDEDTQTTAVTACEDGTCVESTQSDTTVANGTYSMKLNAGKAKKCEKNGVSDAVLGVPAYAR